MSSLRNQSLRTVGRKKKRKQQPGETKAPWCKGLPRWHWNRRFRGKRKKMLQSCKFPTARRSKKQESAQTSNISHSQVEERKLLHTNLMQTETEPSWDNGRGKKSPQDKNRELQTRLDFVQLLSEWRNLSQRVDAAAPAEMLAELSSRAAWTLWCQENCACCVFCSKLLECLSEVSNLRQLHT